MPEDLSKPKNIFEAAASAQKAHARKAPPVKKEVPQKAAVPEERGEERAIVSDIFIKGKKMNEELASQVDSLFTKNKIAPSDYRRYVSRPQNFSQKQWQQLEEQRKKNEGFIKELAKKIGAKPPAAPPPKKEEAKSPEKEAAPPEKKPPLKKPKIITRRQWIGM